MISTGMIFQFNSEAGEGRVMFSDGGQKEFSLNDWADESNDPAVGQKISYDTSGNNIKIKVLGADVNIISEKKPNTADEATDENNESKSADEYISQFLEEGYKLVNDFENAGVRKAMLRKFSEQSHEEIKMTESDGEIVIAHLVNGKPVK